MSIPLRVLIVEDQLADAELMMYALRQADYAADWQRVDTEPDYLRSLDPPPDVILADYSLPQFNAMRALALLQERGLDIPFIIVTGTIGEEMAVATIQQGAADYLLKDRLTRLGSAVARALEQKRLRLEKQEADQALRDREKRFRALIENSADAISLLDAQGIILYTSPAATRILGYPAEELAGRNASELIHPGDKAYARNLFAQLVQAPGASVTGLYRNCHKDGSWRWIEGTATNLLADPSVQAIVANYRDVTERKQREREREAIIAVATALRAAPTRTAMLPVLLDQLLNLLQVRGAAVAMRDPVTGGIVIELGRGEWARATHTHLPPHEGISAQVMATRQPYVSSDIRSDERFTWPDLLGATNAVACVPLIAQEQAIGVLGVGGDTPLGEAEVRLLMAVADMAANAIHRASLHEQTEQSLRRLAALRTIDMAISASLDLRMTLDIFLSQVTAQLSVDAAAVLLLDPHTQLLRYVAGRGFRGSGIDRTQLRLGEGRAGYAALERQIVKIPNLAEAGPDSLRAQLLASEEIVAYYAAPLLAKGQVTGVLEIFHRSVLEPDSEWLRFLEALAGQAAIAIENATLFESLERSNIELTLAYDATIEGWSRALDLRDRETEGHSERVTEMTLRLARLLEVSETEMVHVRRGALLHDMGKMGIPDRILLKPGPLSDEDLELMREHPTYAYQMLSPIAYLRPALDIPYCHHEHWDGQGYPRGLKGEQIPLVARIFAVVDVWDALRSNRPYRMSWPETKVLDYIRSRAGQQFDPAVVQVFLQIIERPQPL